MWKQACEGMITTQKYSKHNLDKYVYDLEVLQNVFGQVCVSMCRYVYDLKVLQTEFGQACVGMCMTQKCSKLNLDKYV